MVIAKLDLFYLSSLLVGEMPLCPTVHKTGVIIQHTMSFIILQNASSELLVKWSKKLWKPPPPTPFQHEISRSCVRPFL